LKRKEKKADSQLVQTLSSLLAGVLLAFGVSVLVLFTAAHLMAVGRLGETGYVEGAAAAIGCLCGGLYTALSCQRRTLLLGTLTGVVFYAVWTVVGLIGYTDTGVLDGVRNLMAAATGGVMAGLLSAWLRPQRK
jgi:putative membrane protein (TIGR04086 family)